MNVHLEASAAGRFVSVRHTYGGTHFVSNPNISERKIHVIRS